MAGRAGKESKGDSVEGASVEEDAAVAVATGVDGQDSRRGSGDGDRRRLATGAGASVEGEDTGVGAFVDKGDVDGSVGWNGCPDDDRVGVDGPTPRSND